MKYNVLDDNIWLLWVVIFMIWPFVQIEKNVCYKYLEHYI
jgi:hypothetical protein